MDYKDTTNANPVNDIQTKIAKPDGTKDIFLKPKVTERMASGWMTVWRLDTGGAKAIRKDTSQDGGGNDLQLGGGARRKAKMQIEALKAYRLKNVWRREYHFHQ